MICYKDRAFCSSDCVNRECYRNLTPELREGARRWWSHDPDNVPIAFSDFSKDCVAYIKPE